MKILFTGGGTAGHIFPIIAVARELRRLGLDWKFYYVGPKDEFGSILLSQEDVEIKTILAGKIRRYANWKSITQNIFDILFKIPAGFLQSFFYVFFTAPDLIFSKGGYGSLPSVFSGWFLQVPILLHESDVVPGLANKLLSKLVSKIFVSFPVSQTEYFSEKKMVSIGNPVRIELLGGSKEGAQKLFNLTEEKPVILIMGGSQGAQKINDTILEILPQILSEFELIHQTGEKNFEEVRNESKVVITPELERFYHPVGFLKEIELREAYAASDLILSRAGSGSIFEIAALGKPSVLVPLALAAQDHQAKNAYAYAEGSKGATLVIEEANLTPHFLLEKIKYIFAVPGELEKMSKAAKSFAKPDSGLLIAEYIMNYYKK
ncbi:MAG: UDP-N-acetylglucosamine--N-acetylmuramyl-(pentapeptide) pyrophosphoryl-undecaprenol N-acetylglucosamine transferase [Candidatus Nealsonbacteria bacterium]|nr:UDP-N-acetylglucosamine--N-acetylmuramyl-(pentapeptide) pyrophosphoryl-undecaprenol N-acetylglucosamine transferase [Candidatus Nealsonbacteria bacterium]